MDNMELWNYWRQPPVKYLKNFDNGTYKGTDISPQWRYMALTEKYGAIGIGWYYTIDKQWTEQGADGVFMAMANISLYIKTGDTWSMPIQGTGGNNLINRFKNKYAKEGEEQYYLKTSDEGYKMAVTDALSVACKMLGIGADIYLGNFDGSKYRDVPVETKPVDNGEVSKLKAELKPYCTTDAQKAWLEKTNNHEELEKALTKILTDKTIYKIHKVFDGEVE